MAKKLVYGVGIDDLDYKKREREVINGKGVTLWVCPYYSKWRDMIRRCYSKRELLRNPVYEGCTVCDEWLVFSKFKCWMESFNWQGLEIDKDLIGDGKTYSPNNCIWIPHKINTFITDRKNSKDSSFLGAVFQKDCGKWRSQCQNPFEEYDSYKARGYIGLFHTPEEAHEAWRKKKHEYACQLADSEYVTDPRVAEALRERFSYENWYNTK